MSRETCPKCKKPGTVTKTRNTGDFIVQYYGCRQCGNHTLGSDVTPVPKDSSRTNRNQ